MSTISARSQGKRPAQVPPVPPPPPSQKPRTTKPEYSSDEEEEATMEPQVTPSSSSSRIETHDDRNKAKVNPPETFKGERGKLKTFITQCNLYMYWNRAEFGTAEKRVMFVISYMRGTAYAWIEDRLNEYLMDPTKYDERTLFTNYPYFLRQLNMIFGNIDEKRIAERELKTLRQHTSAADYSAHFQRIAAHLNWGSEALLSRYYDGLKEDIKDEISRKENQPDSLFDMIEISIKIDNRLFERKLQKRGQASYRSNNHTRPNTSARRVDPYGPMPMELDKLQTGPRNFKRKGQGRAQDGAQKGNCYNCGKSGHYANKCRQPKRNNGHFARNHDAGHVNMIQSKGHVAMISSSAFRTSSAIPKAEWGPNQAEAQQNLSAATRIVIQDPSVKSNATHKHHWILPMNWCESPDCNYWEHKHSYDKGEEDWIFHPFHEYEICPTQLRRVMLIPDIRTKHEHVHHGHLPMNWCASDSCYLVQHQMILEANDWGSESIISELALNQSDQEEVEEKESNEDEESSSDDEDAEYSTFRINRFIKDVTRAIDQDHPHHKGINPDACIDFSCPHHPHGRRNLRRLRQRLDVAVNTKQANGWFKRSENEEDQQ